MAKKPAEGNGNFAELVDAAAMVVLHGPAMLAAGGVEAAGLLPLQVVVDPTTAAITRHFIRASTKLSRLEALEGGP